MFNLQVPFFEPLWIRIATAVVVLGWAGFELITGSPGWAMMFGAAGAYAAYQFFVVWDPKEEDDT
jgi:hypothetical protein